MGGSISCSKAITAVTHMYHNSANMDCREETMKQICNAFGSTFNSPAVSSVETSSTVTQSQNSNDISSSGFHFIEINTSSSKYGFTTEECLFTIVIIIGLCALGYLGVRRFDLCLDKRKGRKGGKKSVWRAPHRIDDYQGCDQNGSNQSHFARALRLYNEMSWEDQEKISRALASRNQVPAIIHQAPRYTTVAMADEQQEIKVVPQVNPPEGPSKYGKPDAPPDESQSHPSPQKRYQW